MKLLNIYKILITGVVAAVVLCSSGCSDNTLSKDTSEVSFTAVISTSNVKSYGGELNVDKLVVGVLQKGETIDATIPGCSQYREIKREYFDISGDVLDVTLKLANQQDYSLVFWAYNSGSDFYDLSDLSQIKMNIPNGVVAYADMEKMDAFYASILDFTMEEGIDTYPQKVMMERPLAQINVGTTGTPVPAVFSASSVCDTFHPMWKGLSGRVDVYWKFEEISDEVFIVDAVSYKYMAMGYLFAPYLNTMDMSCTLSYTDDGVDEVVEIDNAAIEANHKTNIAGPFTNK